MARFSVTAPGTTGGDANEAVGVLWNPHGTMALRVCSVELSCAVAVTGGTEVRLSRVSTAGTAGGTITPDVDNHHGRRAAPVSGALYYRANFTAAPTEETPALFRVNLTQPVGSMVGWYFPKKEPLIVPAGTGLAMFSVAALTGIPVWVWEE